MTHVESAVMPSQEIGLRVTELIARYLADRKAGYERRELVLKTDLSRDAAEDALKHALSRTTATSLRMTSAGEEFVVFGWINSQGVRLIPSRRGNYRNSWRREFNGQLVEDRPGAELSGQLEPQYKSAHVIMMFALGFAALYSVVNGTVGLGNLLGGHHTGHAVHQLQNAAAGALIFGAALTLEFVAQRSALKADERLRLWLRRTLAASDR